MNQSMTGALAMAGRLLIAWMFIPAGLSKITGYGGSVAYAASAGLPLPEIGVGIGLLIELIGGILVLIGWMTRPAALALAFFTLVASFFFHNYWSMAPEQAMMQKLMFNKNLAITGGLLVLAAFGAGKFSVDAQRKRL